MVFFHQYCTFVRNNVSYLFFYLNDLLGDWVLNVQISYDEQLKMHGTVEQFQKVYNNVLFYCSYRYLRNVQFSTNRKFQ